VRFLHIAFLVNLLNLKDVSYVLGDDGAVNVKNFPDLACVAHTFSRLKSPRKLNRAGSSLINHRVGVGTETLLTFAISC